MVLNVVRKKSLDPRSSCIKYTVHTKKIDLPKVIFGSEGTERQGPITTNSYVRVKGFLESDVRG